MQPYDFEQSIGYWLTVVTQSYHRVFNEQLIPQGITYRQSQVVAWLALEEELTLSQLAHRMMIEPSTLVGVVERMVKLGWISRDPCDEDRRKKMLRLTPAAEPIWEQFIRCAKRVRHQATAGLSPEQTEMLIELLRQVQSNLLSPVSTDSPALAELPD